MLLEKIKAKSQRGWHSFARIFTSRSKQRPIIDGRLSVLPYDLLEEIATYLSWQETVPLLTVNSYFHDAFARGIWRKLYLDDKLANRIPTSAWEIYGHLVRIATVTFCEPREHYSMIQMPNVVDLTLDLTDRGYRIFEGIELNNLHFLHLNLPLCGWTSFATFKDVGLVQGMERSDHPLTVYCDINVETQKHMEALDEILDSIVNTAQYSFKVTAHSIPYTYLRQLPKLAEMLTELDLSDTKYGLSCFLDKSDISFPRLVKLNLGYTGFNRDSLFSAYDLIPDRFPVLQRMTFVRVSQFDHELLERLFSHDWPSLNELVFYKDCTIFVYELIANHVPNLQRLVVNGYKNVLDINQVAEHIPQLQYLEVDQDVQFIYQINRQPRRQLVNLKSFVFKPAEKLAQCFIRKHILNFILLGAPNLESIELKEGCFDRKALYGRRRNLNPSVRTLSIEYSLHKFDSDTAKMLIDLFPNLHLLKLKTKHTISRDMLVDQSNKILRIQYVN